MTIHSAQLPRAIQGSANLGFFPIMIPGLSKLPSLVLLSLFWSPFDIKQTHHALNDILYLQVGLNLTHSLIAMVKTKAMNGKTFLYNNMQRLISRCTLMLVTYRYISCTIVMACTAGLAFVSERSLCGRISSNSGLCSIGL